MTTHCAKPEGSATSGFPIQMPRRSLLILFKTRISSSSHSIEQWRRTKFVAGDESAASLNETSGVNRCVPRRISLVGFSRLRLACVRLTLFDPVNQGYARLFVLGVLQVAHLYNQQLNRNNGYRCVLRSESVSYVIATGGGKTYWEGGRVPTNILWSRGREINSVSGWGLERRLCAWNASCVESSCLGQIFFSLYIE